MESDGVLSYIGESGRRAWSEEPRVKDYEEFFADQLTRAQYIIHISMAKGVSGGYEHALEASKIFDNVTVIDSGHLSSGMGLMALRASACASDGMTVEAILSELEQMKPYVSTSFIVDSTEYLARVGRIPARINKICQTLMLHPVITLKKSNMNVAALCIGTRDYTWRKYIDAALRNVNTIDPKILFITYAGLTEEELKDIEAQVQEKISFESIIYQKASPAISTNCGPGSFGLLFIRKY